MSKVREKEEFQSSLKLLAKTSFIVFIGVILSKVLSYGYRIIIAQYYGPEVYGLYSLAIVIVSLFVAVSSWGLSDGLLRFIPYYRGKKAEAKIRYLLRFSERVSLISGIIAAVVLYILSETISVDIFHDAGLIPYLHVLCILVPLTIFANLYLPTIRAFERISAYSFIFNVLQNVGKIAALGIFIFLGLHVNAILFAHIVGIGIMLLVAYLYCRYKLPVLFGPTEKKGTAEIKKEFLMYSLPLLFYSVFSMLFFWIDSLSIGYLLDATQVGFYNAAVPLAGLLYFVPELFIQLLFPLITRAYGKRNMPLIEDLVKQINKWILIINLPLFTVLMLFPGLIVKLFFGTAYTAAGSSLRFLAFGALVYSLSQTSMNLVSMAGRSKFVFVNMLIASVINIILNFILIPKLGIVGASIATAISFVVMGCLFFFEARHFLKIVSIRRTMLRVLVCGALSAGLLLLVRNYIDVVTIPALVVVGFFFGCTYLALIFITRSVDVHDWEILRSVRTTVAARFRK